MNNSFAIRQPPEFICPRHGDISTQTVSVDLFDMQGTYCLACMFEKMRELGCLQRVYDRNNPVERVVGEALKNASTS